MSALLLFVWFFALAIGILWIFVPFLIMGTNRRLDRLIRQNSLLLERVYPSSGDRTKAATANDYFGALKSLVTGKDD